MCNNELNVEWDDVSELLNEFHARIDKMNDEDAYMFLKNVLSKMD